MPLDEQAPMRPANPYAASKAACDLAIGEMALRGLDAVRLRAFNHTGPGQSEDFVVAAFARQIALFVTTMLGMPLKRALGTSLVLIAVIAIPGTIVHAALGHIDWEIAFVLVLGVIPGARLGASIALGTRERTLRLLVGSFLFLVAAVYGIAEVARLARG